MFDIKKMMEQLRLTDESLAKRAHVHVNTIRAAKLEGGKRNTRPDVLRKLATALEEYATEVGNHARALRAEADSRDPPTPEAAALARHPAAPAGGVSAHQGPAQPAARPIVPYTKDRQVGKKPKNARGKENA